MAFLLCHFTTSNKESNQQSELRNKARVTLVKVWCPSPAHKLTSQKWGLRSYSARSVHSGHSATTPHHSAAPPVHTRTSRQTLWLVRLYGKRLPVIMSVTCELFWGVPPCAACGIVDPNQGSNLHPFKWKCWNLTTGPPGKSWASIVKTEKNKSENVLRKWQYIAWIMYRLSHNLVTNFWLNF